MNLDSKNVPLIFLTALLLTLLIPSLIPDLRLLFFAPFLIILFYRESYLYCLWASLLCGSILDLLSAHVHFGLYAMDYCLTTALLYGQRRHFFSDSLSTLPIMTFFFSFLSTILQVFLKYVFEKENVASRDWVMTDLFAFPFCDALYSFSLFILPCLLFSLRPNRRKKYYS